MTLFEKEFSRMSQEVHQLARDKGWYDGAPRTSLELLMLVVGEVAEASECIRNGEKFWHLNAYEKPEGELAELADVVIRVMDIAASRGWDLGWAIVTKHNFNKSRPYRHGNKAF